jgi:isoquinoline 1-oxidoreductase alpha subunit
MSPLKLTVNDQVYTLDVDPSMPLLWAIRDFANLTGTKYGCGVAQCGACTVHLDGKAVRSCSVPVSTAVNKKIITIEGLSPDGSHPLQRAWQEEDVPQCGYCQAGQIMTAASLLSANGNPTDEEIVTAMTGNICRCGTYNRIHKAIKRAIELTAKK